MHYENEFSQFNRFHHGVPDPSARTATGHVPNKYFIGPAILWFPFFVAAHISTLVASQLGFGLAPDGYSLLYQIFIGLGSICYGLIGLVLIYRILLQFFSKETALFATTLVTLATNVFYYLTIEPAMSHAMTLFAVSLFVWLWLKDLGGRSRRGILLLGLSAGLMSMIRPQDILFSILYAAEWVGFVGRKGTAEGIQATLIRRILNAALFALGFVAALIPEIIVWKILYGSWLLYSYAGEPFYPFAPHLLDSLFSAYHGLISWTPIVAFALAGLLLFLTDQPRIGLLLLIAFVLQWYLNASWWCWWFGVSFGNRAYVSCSFLFAIGIATLLARLRHWRKSVQVICGILICWNLLFTAQYALQMLPLNAPVEWRQVLVNQYRVIGRAIDFVRPGNYPKPMFAK
ncbi:glycosyltransferase family 39 protein [Desulfatirhabdium butyrativorans]|uniref:glycosyltransferase family 39 protein n=1 Tax=Desulfatirhabdium butyrativorans TaxID=340467 RepID=UPI0004233388|nr:glycosyltransferase family 39 protein [Desulfatirhabdium butyrativorans]